MHLWLSPLHCGFQFVAPGGPWPGGWQTAPDWSCTCYAISVSTNDKLCFLKGGQPYCDVAINVSLHR